MKTRWLNYGKIVELQKQDMISKKSEYYVYRHFSSPFTWLFVNFGIAPNTITISSIFLCVIGFFFMASGRYVNTVIGLLILILFKIMDMSDGEVARIENKKSLEGIYFDRISHYVYTCCLGLGMGLGFFRLYEKDYMLLLAFFFTMAFVLENAAIDMLKSVLREGFDKIKAARKEAYSSEDYYKRAQKKIFSRINANHSWAESNIFIKLFGILPIQGLIYSDTFIAPILLLLTIIEIQFNFTILPFYLLIVSFSKAAWIIFFLAKIEMKRSITGILGEANEKE